jgi:hypothetical protein
MIQASPDSMEEEYYSLLTRLGSNGEWYAAKISILGLIIALYNKYPNSVPRYMEF